jgi:hypothetical protein
MARKVFPTSSGSQLADTITIGVGVVHVRHDDIHGHDVGSFFPDRPDGLLAVACRSDDLDGRVGREDKRQKVPHDLGVFNDKHFDHFRSSRF